MDIALDIDTNSIFEFQLTRDLSFNFLIYNTTYHVLCPMSYVPAKFCFLLGHDNIAILVRPYVLMSSCPQQQARAAEGCPERRERRDNHRTIVGQTLDNHWTITSIHYFSHTEIKKRMIGLVFRPHPHVDAVCIDR